MAATDEMVIINTLESGIVEISLNRPEQLNALSQEVLQQLDYFFDKIKNDPTVSALLITGAGKGFCAGADIKELLPLDANKGYAFAQYGQKVFRSLEELNKPSLVALHGFAFGGGLEFAMSASLRIAAENTLFGQPEIKLGVIPGFGGTQRLPRLIGKGRALELCLTGKRFSAKQALEWGLITEMVSSADLRSRAIAILSEIVSFSPIAIQHILSAFRQGYDLPLQDACAVEASLFGLCCASKDKKEGVSAFLEKRQAQFIGA